MTTRRERRAALMRRDLRDVPASHLLQHLDLEPEQVRLRSCCPLCVESVARGDCG